MALTKSEVTFLQGMVEHHESAIKDSKKMLTTAKDPFVVKLATAIVKAQESEIKDMKARLKEDGQQATSGGGSPHGSMKMGKSIDWDGSFLPVNTNGPS